MKVGKFITLEGGEGVGKTTNIPFIKNCLEEKGLSVLITREPGGTLLAEKIRELLIQKHQETVTSQAELLLMFAGRSLHIENVIKPALKQGKWVICDRFTDASYAYQGGGRGIDEGNITWLENFTQGELRPNLTLLLDMPVAPGMQRAKNRSKPDRFEIERLDFFEKVRESYLTLATQYPHRIKVINAQLSLIQVQSQIIETLSHII